MKRQLDHPYQQHERSKEWIRVQTALTDLMGNGDIKLQTRIEYVVGYICELLVRPEDSASQPGKKKAPRKNSVKR